jgi:lipooligosaccharide transport system permease protein
MTRAFRIGQRNGLVYRRMWHSSLFLSFLQPLLFLTAMGIGLGRMIDRGGAALPGGITYLEFLGPGLLAATCMQTASFESSFPITGKMTWRRNYEAIAATPVGVADIVAGELAWIVVRLTTIAVAFTLMLLAFGAVHTVWMLAAIPAAVLTGLAFSAPVMAYAGMIKSGGNFNAVFRFIITPLFLFSGVFFPITQLPSPLQTAAAFTPLYHGVALTRGLALDTLTWPAALVHVLYLVGLVAIGMAAAVWTFSRKLRA